MPEKTSEQIEEDINKMVATIREDKGMPTWWLCVYCENTFRLQDEPIAPHITKCIELENKADRLRQQEING